MRKALLPILLLLVLTVPIIGGEPERNVYTSVLIDSRPDLSEIQIDGKFIGSTPLNYKLSAGQHRIVVSHPGRATWTRDLTVTSDIPTRVTALLEHSEKEPCATATARQ